jgi:hypothetical protein
MNFVNNATSLRGSHTTNEGQCHRNRARSQQLLLRQLQSENSGCSPAHRRLPRRQVVLVQYAVMHEPRHDPRSASLVVDLALRSSNTWRP